MKKYAILAAAFVLITSTGCTSEQMISTVDDLKPKTTSTAEVQPTTADNSLVLTADDIFIANSGGYDLEDFCVLITEEEQIDFAHEVISGFLDPNSQILSDYPLGDYVYVIDNHHVGCGGYHLEADKLHICEDSLWFEMSENSVYPDPDEPTPDVMDGFLFFAAVPREYLNADLSYNNYFIPDTTDYKAHCNYFSAVYRSSDPEFAADLTESRFRIESQEELDSLTAQLHDEQGYFPSYLAENALPSFEDTVMFLEFSEMPPDKNAFVTDTEFVDGELVFTPEYREWNNDPEMAWLVCIACVPREFL